VIGALLALAVVAPLAVLASEMPRVAAVPLAGAAFAWGVVRAWREARRPACELLWPAGGGPPELDGLALEGAVLEWRGPLAFVRWRGGRLSWWPDTLPPDRRRELRRVMAP
jgi:toxin CptA